MVKQKDFVEYISDCQYSRRFSKKSAYMIYDGIWGRFSQKYGEFSTRKYGNTYFAKI